MPATYAKSLVNLTRRSRQPERSPSSAGPSNSRENIEVNDEHLSDSHFGRDENDEEEEESDGVDGWTEDTFVDLPITNVPNSMTMLRNLVDKLKQAILQLERAMDRIKETAIALEEASPDDSALQNVETSLFKVYDYRCTLDIHISCLEDLQKQLFTGQQIIDIEKVYKGKSSQRIEEYNSKSARAKYKKLDDYSQFRSHLWEINHTTACPPMSYFLAPGSNDEDLDDDIDVGGQTQTYRCPITLMLYQDATTCTKCKHTYTKAAIYDLIDNAKRQHRKAQCPVTGCNKIIDKSDLKPNPSMQKRANDFARRQQDRENDREEDTASVVENDED
ncbi:hypothetical protein L204_100143 [Cryptococcus depauperatus]